MQDPNNEKNPFDAEIESNLKFLGTQNQEQFGIAEHELKKLFPNGETLKNDPIFGFLYRSEMTLLEVLRELGADHWIVTRMSLYLSGDSSIVTTLQTSISDKTFRFPSKFLFWKAPKIPRTNDEYLLALNDFFKRYPMNRAELFEDVPPNRFLNEKHDDGQILSELINLLNSWQYAEKIFSNISKKHKESTLFDVYAHFRNEVEKEKTRKREKDATIRIEIPLLLDQEFTHFLKKMNLLYRREIIQMFKRFVILNKLSFELLDPEKLVEMLGGLPKENYIEHDVRILIKAHQEFDSNKVRWLPVPKPATE